MKKNIQISLLLGSILFAFSCNNTPTEQSVDYDAMAQDLCKCMTPLMDIQQKISALSAEGKTDEIQLLLGNVEKLSEEGDECVAKLEAKYGVVENENEAKANAAFQKACPAVAGMLNDAVE